MNERSTLSGRMWFQDDIENTIKAVDLANYDAVRNNRTPEMQLYRLGYEAAINALVMAFGLKMSTYRLSIDKDAE